MPVKLSGGALVYRGNGSIPFRVKIFLYHKRGKRKCTRTKKLFARTAVRSSSSRQVSRSFMQKRASRTSLPAARRAAMLAVKGQRVLYDAVCAECGKEAKVPFKPTEDRPVYCSDCYAKLKEQA